MDNKNEVLVDVNSNEIQVLDLIVTILNGKKFIFFFVAIFVLASFIYAYGQTPIYKADVLLQVESHKSKIPGLDDLAGFGGEPDASVSTEIEIIKSRRNLGEAIDKLHLDIVAYPIRIPLFGNFYKKFFNTNNDIQKLPPVWNWLDEKMHPYAWGNESINVSRFDVPVDFLNKKLTVLSKGSDTYNLLKDEVVILEGKVGQLSSTNNGLVNVNIRELIGLSGTKFVLFKSSKLNVITSLQKSIKASEKGKNTGIISLVLEGVDKTRIVETLDHISTTYLGQNKSRSSEDASSALEFLEKQIKPIKKSTDKAEGKLKLYRTRHQTADISMETQAVLDVVSGLDTELQKLSLKRDELGQKYTSSHPIIQAIGAQEAKLVKRKKQTLAKISKLPETQQTLLKLERDYKVANTIYLDLLNKIQEFNIAKASSVGNVYILDTAVVYESPVRPNKALILLLGAFLGSIFGVLLVLVKKMFHQTVYNPERIEEKTGIPVYATVPFSTGVKLTSGFNRDKRQKSLLAINGGTDPAIESLRSLRTSLHFALLEAKNNIVMITGPSPGIGKSFISSNFAAVLASAEQKVLLIDADMRKGYLHSLLNKKISPGLSDLISKQVGLKEAVHTIQVGENSLDVITRGKTPPNPSELLMNSGFKELLDQLSKQYDLILIDTPPVHAVTDPAIIGALAGVVFMVVYSDQHSMKEIEHAVMRLSHTGIETKGFIFNGYNAKKSFGYSGYGYNSYYGDYKSDNL